MKRFADKRYGTFSRYSAYTIGLEVKCPYCGKLGTVKMDDVYFYFQCATCGKRHQKERIEYRYQISEMCNKCDRHFRLDIDKTQEQFKTLNIVCPYCGNKQTGIVQKTQKGWYNYGEIKNGIEPFFNYQLFYQTTDFNGKLIWAINREHLIYLPEFRLRKSKKRLHS